tara:strand:+ start:759 stop:1070 length:312 start_codon:yes stop_codon:yes gene_type:complete
MISTLPCSSIIVECNFWNLSFPVPVLLKGGKLEDLGAQVDEAKVVLAHLDKHLASHKYLVGDHPTLADLFVVPEVMIWSSSSVIYSVLNLLYSVFSRPSLSRA